MAPSVQRVDPPYLQVVAQIRERIQTGELQEGDRVPSARQMMRDWGISLATATRVLGELRAEGLTHGVRGIGTVVTAVGHSPGDRLTTGRRTGRIYPADEHAIVRAAALVRAPQWVADALGVVPDALAIQRRRVTYRGDSPSSASTSWYDGTLAQVAPKLLQAERIPEGTPAYIEAMTGRAVVSGRDQVGARIATADDVEALGVESDAAVLYGRNWYYDGAGRVIEYGEYASLGDRLRSYEYSVGG